MSDRLGLGGGVKKYRGVSIPLRDKPWLWLYGGFPITESEWEYMMRVLRKMRRQLARPDDPPGWMFIERTGRDNNNE